MDQGYNGEKVNYNILNANIVSAPGHIECCVSR